MYFGWHPWYYGPNFGMHISKYTEGTLFVDLIDANKKELATQSHLPKTPFILGNKIPLNKSSSPKK